MKLTLLFFLLMTTQVIGQENNFNSVLSNVVDLGGGNFGLVTGGVDENTLSFITVADSKSVFFSGISVKFFGIETESTAYLIKTFVFGNYTLALYECSRPKNLILRSNNYDFFSSPSNSFRTFLDNGKSDNQWSAYREQISLISLSNNVASMRMNGQSIFSRGMPVINEQGSLVGMIASESSDEGVVSFDVIDFSVIEQLLYDFEKCKYFKLILFGQKLTICDKEELEYALHMQEDKRKYRASRKYNFTAAPAIRLGMLIDGANYPYSSDIMTQVGYGFTVGINFHINADRRFRLNLKPRLGYYYFSRFGSEDYLMDVGQFEGINFQLFEIPIILEYVIKYYKKQNIVISFGYVPIIELTTNAIFWDSQFDATYSMEVKDSTSQSSLLFELSLERRKSKWSFNYSMQLNEWVDPNYELSKNNQTITPFQGQKSFSPYFGVEFSYRLWGNWLTKE